MNFEQASKQVQQDRRDTLARLAVSDRTETRTTTHPVQFRSSKGERGTATGTAIVYDSLSVDLGGFRERISPKALDRSLEEAPDVLALADHDYSKVLGRTSAGTLRLDNTPDGLDVEIDLAEGVSYADDLRVLLGRGDITGMSFGFRVLDEEWSERADGSLVRDVLDLELFEVSVVSRPAYEDTRVSVRSLDEVRRELGGSLHQDLVALQRARLAGFA